jgi:hypothetical protein
MKYCLTLIFLTLYQACLFADDKDINVNIKTGNSGGWPAMYWIVGALVLALLIAITAIATRSRKQA